MNPLIDFFKNNSGKLLEQSLEHIGLTFISLFLAVLIAVPAGIYIAKRPKLASGLIGFTGILQTIPSIALLGFLIPVLGIGVKPAILALFLYALLPILRNTFTGIREVPKSVIEAARGMGMTNGQILRKVELPLAMSVIFAGVRTATVINVGVATLAAYVGAGGLGEFIFGGISLNNSSMILAGAIPAAGMAILFDQLLAVMQNLPAKKMQKTIRLASLALFILSLSFFSPPLLIRGMSAGFDPEFQGRSDGYPALQERYGLVFNSVLLNAALMYSAVENGEVDLIAGYATDGRIKAYNLQVLEDDRHAFPPYYCTPIVRNDFAEEQPEVMDALSLLTGQMSDSIMTELNYRVDIEKLSPASVATDFLKSIDLWKPDRFAGGKKILIGGKNFTEQFILAELFAQLINGYTDLDVELKLGLGGTKICFDALVRGELDIYPEYTGTGFMVILSPSEEEVKERIADPNAVYEYVSNTFDNEYQIKWLEPLGFNNTYALMIPKERAQKMGWKKISDLQK